MSSRRTAQAAQVGRIGQLPYHEKVEGRTAVPSLIHGDGAGSTSGI